MLSSLYVYISLHVLVVCGLQCRTFLVSLLRLPSFWWFRFCLALFRRFVKWDSSASCIAITSMSVYDIISLVVPWKSTRFPHQCLMHIFRLSNRLQTSLTFWLKVYASDVVAMRKKILLAPFIPVDTSFASQFVLSAEILSPTCCSSEFFRPGLRLLLLVMIWLCLKLCLLRAKGNYKTLKTLLLQICVK